MAREDEIIVCRCEDITLAELRAAIEAGYTEFEELKRYLRIGMGPCQGRTCIPIVRRELARYLGVRPEEIKIPTKRPPVVNILFGTIEKYREENL
ncbi:MAG: (2Fe-2S)-binding protein [Thermoplasmata archaeon]|nr:MAG: (2Fe-2S)-binding protein [Thermoplasmata archaeon]